MHKATPCRMLSEVKKVYVSGVQVLAARTQRGNYILKLGKSRKCLSNKEKNEKKEISANIATNINTTLDFRKIFDSLKGGLFLILL
ncbi:hypothetical protein BKH45_06395 [Helicobacter sp. 11S03491-1]|nr:hypothetical protein BKH45_06395 [Helicobacter sp. 11S03491-1]